MENLIKLDKHNISFIDDNNIQKEEIFLERETYNYTPQSHFYTFGNDNYLIKVDYQKILFHDARTRKMIEEFQNRRKLIPNVEFTNSILSKRW